MLEAQSKALHEALAQVNLSTLGETRKPVRNKDGSVVERVVYAFIAWTTYHQVGFDGSMIESSSTTKNLVLLTEDHELVFNDAIESLEFVVDHLDAAPRKLLVTRLSQGEGVYRRLLMERWWSVLRDINVPESYIRLEMAEFDLSGNN